MTRTVLLTAFEPFDGASTNPSMTVVEQVAATWDRQEELRCVVLPVAYDRARLQLMTALAQVSPDVVVGVGLASGRAIPSVERLAVNIRDARIPDNDGAQPGDEPVIPSGPLALLASLPVRATVARLREAGHAVELSMTAGTFVCNTVFYVAAAWADAGPDRRAGFVHVPADRFDDSVAVVRAAIDDAFDLERDLVVPMGATD